MTGAGKGKGKVDSYGGFSDATFCGGNGDGFADGEEAAFLWKTALYAGELGRGAGARETKRILMAKALNG